MRDYAVVPAKFWITPLAKSLRGNPNAQVVALYLKTGPHANMIGLYHCPIGYIAQDTGVPMEGASKALGSISKAGYCDYDADAEVVFVRDMACEQIGDSLVPTDKRVKAVIKQWQACPSDTLKRAFHDRYARAFSLPPLEGASKPPQGPIEALVGRAASPFEAASEVHRSQDQETEQDQEHSVPTGTGADGAGVSRPVNPAALTAEEMIAAAAALAVGVVVRDRDDKAVLWRGGKALLHVNAGMTIKAAGEVIGKLRRDYGDEVLCDALQRACAEQPPGPVPWLKRMCQLAIGEVSKTNKQSRLEAANDAVGAAFLAGIGATPATPLEVAIDAVGTEFLAGGQQA